MAGMHLIAKSQLIDETTVRRCQTGLTIKAEIKMAAIRATSAETQLQSLLLFNNG
jgi:hypothetical protein